MKFLNEQLELRLGLEPTKSVFTVDVENKLENEISSILQKYKEKMRDRIPPTKYEEIVKNREENENNS